MTEKMTTSKDHSVEYQYIEQRQIGEAYELEVGPKTVSFKTFELKDGKKDKLKESHDRDKPAAFIMGATTESFIQSNLAQLLKEQTAKTDFGVFEVSRFIGFKFINTSIESNIMTIKMKPSNFIFAALVGPIMISFDTIKNKIVKLKGRTPLREKINGKWIPVDAEIIYH